MDTITVEYYGGPADARRVEAYLVAEHMPSPFRIVSMPALFGSALDDHPTVAAEVHRYLRIDDEPYDGVWRYHWAGAVR